MRDNSDERLETLGEIDVSSSSLIFRLLYILESGGSDPHIGR